MKCFLFWHPCDPLNELENDLSNAQVLLTIDQCLFGLKLQAQMHVGISLRAQMAWSSNSPITPFFVCGVSGACSVVLQCGGHERAVRMECAAMM